MNILLTAINSKYIHMNPAVYLLRASAEADRDSVSVAEYTINQQKSEILRDIFLRKPDLLAISCYIWNRETVCSLLRELPKVLPGVPVFLGGPEVSYCAPGILRDFPAVAGVLIGEGEATFRDLLQAYLHNTTGSSPDLSGIPGLCLPAPDRGGSFFTSERPLLSMDEIPFFYEEYGGDPDLGPFRNRILYYESSRGCPFRCSYCLSSVEKTLRLRSLDLVLPELQFFLDHRVRQVKFIDRTFNCDHEHATAIWTYLRDHDNGLTNFHFEIEGTLLTEQELQLLSTLRPGLVQFEVGVQTTNPETLQEIRRSSGLAALRDRVAKLRSFRNIHLHLDLIAGLPYEDLSSFRRSFNDLFDLKPDELQLGFLKVLHGTLMEEKAADYGLLTTEEPPYEVLSTKWLSFSEVLHLKSVEEMLEMYYNSGQFTKTMSALVSLFPDPFCCFEELADHYERNGFFKNQPARVYRYRVILDFVTEHFPGYTDLFRELLTCDLYLRENMKSRPEFSTDLSPYREALRKYPLSRQDHLEVFRYPVHRDLRDREDPLHFLLSAGETASPYFVLFDYSLRDGFSDNVVTQELTEVIPL